MALAVVIENPKTSLYGGVVAGPVFKEITEKVLFYLGVSPDETIAGAKIMPDLKGMSARDILRWAEGEGIKVKLRGSGYAADQQPRAGERIKEGVICSIELKQTI
jgi:cell division protein FtsI (penicillin-binding protein 3)